MALALSVLPVDFTGSSFGAFSAAGALEYQKPNHEFVGAGGFRSGCVDVSADGDSATGEVWTSVWASGSFRGSTSFGCSSAGVNVCVSVTGARASHPNQPEVATGVCEVGCSSVGLVVSSVFGGASSATRDVSLAVRCTAVVSRSFFAISVLSSGVRAPPFSGIWGKEVDDSAGPSKLAESMLFFVSNRRKSGVLEGLSVPPNIVSRASWVEAEDFGMRGQEPYQLRALRTCISRSASNA